MAPPLPELSEFRLERKDNGLVHVVFDAPGRTMNVFSEAAIIEIGLIDRWLEEADVRGAVIRSGKTSGFCAGANLPEIWAAYDMIMLTPEPRRFRTAYDHFFRLSLALRALETCGKPIAAAIAGLALGDGGELALASHYRVLTDKHAAIGLPSPWWACSPAPAELSAYRGWLASKLQCRSFWTAAGLPAKRRLKRVLPTPWSNPAMQIVN